MPGYKLHGRPLLYFASFKERYSLFAASGTFFAMLEEELCGCELRKGTVQLPLTKPVPCRQHEPSVSDAFGRDQGVRQLLNQSRFATHEDHFEAVIVIEMDVNAGYARGVVMMLKLGELLWQQAHVAVANESENPGDLRIR
jgi:hypothetical protein